MALRHWMNKWGEIAKKEKKAEVHVDFAHFLLHYIPQVINFAGSSVTWYFSLLFHSHFARDVKSRPWNLFKVYNWSHYIFLHLYSRHLSKAVKQSDLNLMTSDSNPSNYLTDLHVFWRLIAEQNISTVNIHWNWWNYHTIPLLTSLCGGFTDTQITFWTSLNTLESQKWICVISDHKSSSGNGSFCVKKKRPCFERFIFNLFIMQNHGSDQSVSFLGCTLLFLMTSWVWGRFRSQETVCQCRERRPFNLNPTSLLFLCWHKIPETSRSVWGTGSACTVKCVSLQCCKSRNHSNSSIILHLSTAVIWAKC